MIKDLLLSFVIGIIGMLLTPLALAIIFLSIPIIIVIGFGELLREEL